MKTIFFRRFIGAAICAAFILAAAGCTPESPPLPPLYSDSNVSSESSKNKSEISKPEKNEAGDSKSESASSENEASADQKSTQSAGDPSETESSENEEVSADQKSPSLAEESAETAVSSESESQRERSQTSDARTVTGTKVLTLGSRVPDTVEYISESEALQVGYSTNDEELIGKLTDVLEKTIIGKETQERILDDSDIIKIKFNDRTSESLYFEGGGIVVDGKRYEIEDYSEISAILKEIADQDVPEIFDPAEYDWIERMQLVDDRIHELTNSESFENGDIKEKSKLAMELLKTLEGEGLIRRDSIYDGGDTISFIYECCEEGVCGGIMLRSFTEDIDGIPIN